MPFPLQVSFPPNSHSSPSRQASLSSANCSPQHPCTRFRPHGPRSHAAFPLPCLTNFCLSFKVQLRAPGSLFLCLHSKRYVQFLEHLSHCLTIGCVPISALLCTKFLEEKAHIYAGTYTQCPQITQKTACFLQRAEGCVSGRTKHTTLHFSEWNAIV